MLAFMRSRQAHFPYANRSMLLFIFYHELSPALTCRQLFSSGLLHDVVYMPCVLADCRYYSKVLPPSGTKDAAILDMCSSWVSHYPKGYKLGRISGDVICARPEIMHAACADERSTV